MGKAGSSCEMCGKEDMLLKALVEGVEMKVCKACSSFGKILHVPKAPTRFYGQAPSFLRQPEVVEEIVEEYAIKIKQAREKRNLTQEEFAKMLNEHASLLRNIEVGKQRPTLELAKKLEKMLSIVLVEKSTNEQAVEKEEKKQKGPLTIGDMLSMKR